MSKHTLSTPHQRQAIRCAMRDQDLPTDRITLLHKRLFASASLPAPTPGTDVDSHLCAMRKEEASRLLDALRRQGEASCAR
jgi:CRP-like cAMP-binding protein